MEYYSVIKKNEIMSSAEKWMKLEIILSNEISQTQKSNTCFLSYVESRKK
jgi:hypothetical protein